MKKQSSGTEVHLNLENLKCGPFISTLNYPMVIISSQIDESIIMLGEYTYTISDKEESCLSNIVPW